ncbi:hypothetical protein ACIOEW_36745 [Streptomyces sp. NPDC087901]|uniref:hypothetical protein n=1 Tax=Streptomyces sp. NPDC087901 TaxID=3365818 RepID=UPI00380446A8
MTDPMLVAEDGADIALLMRAHRRLRDLAVQLEVAPFAEQTAACMRAYLDEEAATAQSAFARWVALPKEVRDRAASRVRQEQL